MFQLRLQPKQICRISNGEIQPGLQANYSKKYFEIIYLDLSTKHVRYQIKQLTLYQVLALFSIFIKYTY